MTMRNEDRPGWEGPGSYLECPLCPEVIRLPDLAEVAADDAALEAAPTIQAAIDQRMREHHAATEALVFAHFELTHTMREFAEALGTARNALQEIHSRVNHPSNWGPTDVTDGLRILDHLCHRGLGAGE